MDVLLVRSSVFALPAKKRVGAIFYGGTTALGLWPGPGADSDLKEAWGGRRLSSVLAGELKQSGGSLELGQCLRVQPGRLHCDFLLWIAMKDPEPSSTRSLAPSADLLRRAVAAALAFAASRGVERVAMGALGEGASELDRAERLAVLVRAASEYEEGCFAQGKATVIEEVLICEPLGAVLRAAQAKVGRLARVHDAGPRPVGARGTRTRSTTIKGEKTPRSRAKKAKPKGLSLQEAATGRAAAERYDIHRTYAAEDFLLHPKFGVGRVAKVLDNQAIEVRFEDGSERKMVHAR